VSLRPYRSGLALTGGFVLLDLLWLALLPVLQISYGSLPADLLLFGCARGGLWAVWAAWLALRQRVTGRGQANRAAWPLAAANLALLALALYAYYAEAPRLSVTRIELPAPGLTRPLRIIQLSDLHVEYTSRREQALPGLVASLQPDLIVLTGDYINKLYANDPRTRDDLRALLAQLRAPLGVYAVNGNVETPLQMHRLLDGLDVQILNNQIARVPDVGGHFVIAGLDLVKYSPDQRALKRLMSDVRPDDFSLLLYHKPELAYAARDQGVDLFLTGHTHGGQVRLPFYGAILTNSRLGKTYEMGLYQVGATAMFVSRGLGMGGRYSPRVRFLCPPEVAVIDLLPAP